MAAAMVFSLGMTAFAEEAVEEEEIVVPSELIAQMGCSAARAVAHGLDPDDIVYYDHITVGNTTHLKGDFFTNMWGNTTSDIDVRLLLHGCNLIRWDGSNGMFTADPSVVEGITVTENAAGDRTYTMTLRRDLQYSDGSPITAWDYAFSFLLEMSPAVKLVGAVPMQKEFLIGSEDYSAGRTDVLSGVRVTDDHTIAITLDHEYLPFFYEMGLLSCYPYPISVIAPGSLVRDDGNGVRLDRAFTSALLENTVNNPETGYRAHPSVVSGPYTLVSFDGTTAEFERNPYFHGTAYGEMPLIEKLTYTLAENGTMMDKLESDEFDLLNKVTNADSISRGLALISGGTVEMANYPRSGLMYLVFACEKPTVSSAKVRQAIACCMERDAELYRRALVMRETEPGDVLSYMQKWVSFQERVNEQLPILPIYSNVYFDFFTNLLHDYDISESSTWGEASIGAVKAEIPGVEIEEGDPDGEEMEIG